MNTENKKNKYNNESNSGRERVLIVGLDPDEYTELQNGLDALTVVYEHLPRIRLVDGELLVESRNHSGRFLRVDRVIYHGIFEDDFDFLTALSLWRGPCLPGAMGMVDCRLRHAGLARALRVTSFGEALRGMSLCGDEYKVNGERVAKWGNWHCGENKARFKDSFQPTEPTIYEPFIEGRAVRIVLIGDQYWQIRLEGDDWLKSIHHKKARKMEVDSLLLEDTRRLAKHFNLAIIGVDYIIDPEGGRHLLEVNHIPNVTVFPFMRQAFLELALDWADSRSPTNRIHRFI